MAMKIEDAQSFVATRLALHSIDAYRRAKVPNRIDTAFNLATLTHDNNRAACVALGFGALYDEVFAHLAACNRVAVDEIPEREAVALLYASAKEKASQ